MSFQKSSFQNDAFQVEGPPPIPPIPPPPSPLPSSESFASFSSIGGMPAGGTVAPPPMRGQPRASKARAADSDYPVYPTYESYNRHGAAKSGWAKFKKPRGPKH
jgi:hypothetical protein